MMVRMQGLSTARGAALAGVVAQAAAMVGELSDADRLELVAATARVEAWAASVRAGAVGAVFASVQAELSAELAADEVELAEHARVLGSLSRDSAALTRREAFERERFLHRRVGAEVGLVLGVSSWAADREVDLALDLAAHPPLRRALADGHLDRAQAVVIADALRQVTDPAEPGDPVAAARAGRLLASVLGPDDSPEGDDFDPDEPAYDCQPDGQPVAMVAELCPSTRPEATLWGLVPGRLRAVLAREVLRVDPAAAAERAQRSRAERRVVFEAQPDFMAELHLRAGAEAAGAAFTNLDRTARAARRAGDARNLDQLRADIAIGWLTEGTHGTHITRPQPQPQPQSQSQPADADASRVGLPRQRGPLITLTMAAGTALGLDREPGTLHGPTGPIPVPDQIARQLAAQPGAGWRRLLFDPATGIATDLSSTYRPPAAMSEYVRARDGHQSRIPTSCVSHLELDHVHEYDHVRPDHGGPTTPANLASEGKRDHQLKTDRILTITGNANHTLTITTPSGRTYPSYPHPYTQPAPQLQPVDYTGPPPY